MALLSGDESASWMSLNESSSTTKPGKISTVKKKQKNVRRDLDRQMFNIDLSSSEFRRKAKREEEKSVLCKRRCSQLVTGRREGQAWKAAQDAIRAQNEAFLFNIASEKLKKFNKMICSEDEPEASLQKIIALVDLSVRVSDAAGTIQHLDSWMGEESGQDKEDMVRHATMEPINEDIRTFLANAEARNALREALNPGERRRSPSRESSDWRSSSRQSSDSRLSGRQGSGRRSSSRQSSNSRPGSSGRKVLHSSQTPIDTKPKKKKRRKRSIDSRLAFNMKEVRFTL